ncbi:MAG: hypothetical protein IJX78_03300 [Bacilli bacterium]|nr:hypothetical protein [Bacilli bacterium]
MNEQKEKELYERIYAKQMKYTKKVFCIIFGLISLIFIVLGIILLVEKVIDEDGTMVGPIFIMLGAVFLICVLPFLFIPTKGNYEKYKQRTSKYGFNEPTDAAIKLVLLEAKCQELEKRIEELEN